MQRKVTLSDYEKAIERYNNLASRYGCEVIPCGTIKNPGISDIDCILVANNWEILKSSLKLLNPEALSPLFIHGPFVCTSEILPDLFRYTTLRPLSTDEFEEPTDESRRLIVAARQVGSIIHFDEILTRSRSIRREALILKSILYTFRDCSCFFENNSNYAAEINIYAAYLDDLRKNLMEETIDGRELDELKATAIKLHRSCRDALEGWIKNKFSESLAEPDVLAFFLDAVNGNKTIDHNCSDIGDELKGVLGFRHEIKKGYVDYGILWRGAEAPFHGFDVSSIGTMIWVRRLIKRAFSFYGRMFS